MAARGFKARFPDLTKFIPNATNPADAMWGGPAATAADVFNNTIEEIRVVEAIANQGLLNNFILETTAGSITIADNTNVIDGRSATDTILLAASPDDGTVSQLFGLVGRQVTSQDGNFFISNIDSGSNLFTPADGVTTEFVFDDGKWSIVPSGDTGDLFRTKLKPVRVISGNTHTIEAADSNKTIVFSTGLTPITLTANNDQADGFEFDVLQLAATDVDFVGSSNRFSPGNLITGTSKQWELISFTRGLGAGSYVLSTNNTVPIIGNVADITNATLARLQNFTNIAALEADISTKGITASDGMIASTGDLGLLQFRENLGVSGEFTYPGPNRAWLDANMTGTPSITADFNVSTIGDNATGDFDINFEHDLADENYAMGFCCGNGAGTGFGPNLVKLLNPNSEKNSKQMQNWLNFSKCFC